MSLVDEVRSKKRRATAISVLVVVVTVVLLSAIGVVSVPWGIVLGFIIYFRLTRTDKFAVWLRRFHRSEPTRLRFNMLLNRACAGFCIPITVQDSVFKTSYISSGSRLLLISPLVVGVGTLLYLLCAVSIGFGLSAFGIGDHVALWISLLIALGPLVFFGYAVKKQLVKRGHVMLTPREATEEVSSTLQKITERKTGFRGIMIFKVPDEVWKKVVSLVVSRASAVIIDVSDLTENVLWELKTSLEKHQPESILLTFGVAKNAREELPSAVRAELERAASADCLSRLRVFYYPAEQPPLGPSGGRVFTSLSKRLSAELAACIENTLA